MLSTLLINGFTLWSESPSLLVIMDKSSCSCSALSLNNVNAVVMACLICLIIYLLICGNVSLHIFSMFWQYLIYICFNSSSNIQYLMCLDVTFLSCNGYVLKLRNFLLGSRTDINKSLKVSDANWNSLLPKLFISSFTFFFCHW